MTEVNVPAVGKVKQSYVLIGGGLVAGLVGVAWWKRAHAPTASVTDPYADTRTGSNLPVDTAPNSGHITPTGPSSTGWQAPATDPEWAQQVVSTLSWYEQGYVSATVGKYLAGQLLTPDEATLIREAWAQVGKPPGGQHIITSVTGPTQPVPPPPPTPAPGPRRPAPRPRPYRTGPTPTPSPTPTRPAPAPGNSPVWRPRPSWH